MSSLRGKFCVVPYRVVGAEVWHERLIEAETSTVGLVYIRTPDRDEYPELYVQGSPDIRDVKLQQ